MDGVADIIKDIGFPIMVSLYLLVKVEKQLEVLSQAVVRLDECMNNLKCDREKCQKEKGEI